jgi:hypothetical protein
MTFASVYLNNVNNGFRELNCNVKEYTKRRSNPVFFFAQIPLTDSPIPLT